MHSFPLHFLPVVDLAAVQCVFSHAECNENKPAGLVHPPSSPPTHPPRFRFPLSSVSGSIANPKFPRLWQYLIDSIAASQMPFAPVQRIKCQTSQTLEHLAFFYCSQCKHADTHTDT